MTDPALNLATRLRDGEPTRLLFVKMPAPAEVEMAGGTGFDGVILDTEHGPADAVELEHHVRAADAAGIAALVRVPSLQSAPILAALDAGAAGVIVPHVVDAAQATAVVDAAHYPPVGSRGLALSTRAGRYGAISVSGHLERARAGTLVLVQVEDAAAVARIGEIVAVPGVDGVFIGPNDLSISLGHPGEVAHPEVGSAIATIRDATLAAGLAAVTVVGTPAQAQEWFAAGGTTAVFVASQLTADAFAHATGSAARNRCEDAPLILLPGMLGTGELWRDVAPRLRPNVDLRHGRIDLDDSVAEMADTVLASAPPRFALAGHSLGGIVALAIARRAPARVTRLALLNTSARPGNDDGRAASWQRMREQEHARGHAAFAAGYARENLPAARRKEPALVDTVEAMAREVGRPAFLRQLAAQQTRPDSRPTLPAIRCPTLVVSGALDTIAPPELQQELADGIPHARLEQIDGCGHMSPLEAPERVAELLSDGWE